MNDPRHQRIHALFNELNLLLSDDMSHERDLKLLSVRVTVDACHHDYACLMEEA